MTYDIKALRYLEKRLAEAKGGHDYDAIIERREINAWIHDNLMPEPKVVVPLGYTTSLDAAVALVERVLPGWFWTTGKCKLNAHATVGPDRDGPHAYLLKDPTFDNGFDADMEHGIPALALCLACVRALIAQEEAA